MLIGFYDKTPAIAGAAILPPEVRRALAKIPNPPRSQIIKCGTHTSVQLHWAALPVQCRGGRDPSKCRERYPNHILSASADRGKLGE